MVVSDRNAQAFNSAGAIPAIAPDISKSVDRVWIWYAGLLHKLRSYEILGQVFELILFFLSNR